MTLKSRTRNRKVTAMVVLSAAVLALSQTPAHAARPSRLQAGPRTPQTVTWVGYAASGSSGSFTSISSSWVVPTVNCSNSSTGFAQWVGLDGYGSQTVEQTGTWVDCSSNRYSAWFEMYPAAAVFYNDLVSAGDNMTASVVDNKTGTYTLKISDSTRGWHESVNRNGYEQDASAEAVIENEPTFPSFPGTTFSNVTVNGQGFSNLQPQALAGGGYTPGPLSSSNSFTISPS